MPFLRVWRDKRGYEHTYLIHASNRKGAAARVLYWYRTPPGVKVGRVAFDQEVRQALEAQYPSIVFDWPRLTDTPPPPPDVEHWRERRRQEKAARQARQAADRDDGDEPSDAVADQTELSGSSLVGPDEAVAPEDVPDADVADPGSVGMAPSNPAQPEASGEAGARPRKRRRRGGRRRRKGDPGDAVGGATPAAAVVGADSDGGLDASGGDAGDAGEVDHEASDSQQGAGSSPQAESGDGASDPQQ